MDILAIIPARGGSKSVPRKNVLPVAGKPLLAHSVECALQTQSVTRVVVSTDDPEIAEVAKNYKAEVVWRPAEISGDEASSESALLHVLDHLQTTQGYTPDLVVFLQCTSPLTLPEDVDGTVQALLDEKADSALAVTPFHYFLWQNGPERGAEGINHDKAVRLPRQQLAPQYLETGAVYVMRTAGFKQAKQRFFGKTAMYVIPADRRWEIDEPVDLQVADVLMRKQSEGLQCRYLPDPIEALIFDFDGVFTDNKVLVMENGLEAVICDRGDGMGFDHLKQRNMPILVISSEENPVVKARCQKLGLEYVHAVKYIVRDKSDVLKEWTASHHIDLSHVVYVGNDVNDLTCMQLVGCSIAVSDAHPQARAAARIILNSPGGNGAIREVADLIISRMEK